MKDTKYILTMVAAGALLWIVRRKKHNIGKLPHGTRLERSIKSVRELMKGRKNISVNDEINYNDGGYDMSEQLARSLGAQSTRLRTQRDMNAALRALKNQDNGFLVRSGRKQTVVMRAPLLKMKDYVDQDKHYVFPEYLICCYYDPDGYAVATNKAILVWSRPNYKEDLKGKLIVQRRYKKWKTGDEMEGEFPDWKKLVRLYNEEERTIPGRIVNVQEDELVKEFEDRTDRQPIVRVALSNGMNLKFDRDKWKLFVEAAEALGAKEQDYRIPKKNNLAVMFQNDNGGCMVMPLYDDWRE